MLVGDLFYTIEIFRNCKTTAAPAAASGTRSRFRNFRRRKAFTATFRRPPQYHAVFRRIAESLSAGRSGAVRNEPAWEFRSVMRDGRNRFAHDTPATRHAPFTANQEDGETLKSEKCPSSLFDFSARIVQSESTSTYHTPP